MITVIPLENESLAEAASLERQCFSDGVSEQALRSFAEADANHYFAAMEDGCLCGYGGFSLAADEAEILTVAVAPEHRRRGIARTLMLRMMRDAAGMGAAVLYLDVRESNEAARALYHSLGFEVTGIRRSYYSKPRENAVLMQIPLTGENFGL